MMGSGKSTVGGRLADRLGWSFLDTDLEIESEVGMPIREIFSREGEARFRALEREVLARIPERRTIVALGGGATLSAENRGLLREKGRLVFLDARPDTLASRIGDGGDRPLLSNARGQERVEKIREILDTRREAYASADLRISTDALTIDEVCDAVLRGLGCRGAA
jgi:shikimate kinase